MELILFYCVYSRPYQLQPALCSELIPSLRNISYCFLQTDQFSRETFIKNSSIYEENLSYSKRGKNSDIRSTRTILRCHTKVFLMPDNYIRADT